MSKNRIFLCSDHHFGHKNIMKFGQRDFKTIDEHDLALVRFHNEVVGKDDTVWFLGDVAFGEEALKFVGMMNGNKHLVLGNHDKCPFPIYHKFFQKVVHSIRLKGVLLSHMPVHPCELWGNNKGHGYHGNIHGHMHQHFVNDPRYYNVSMERIDLRPILLEKVLNQLKLPDEPASCHD